MNAGAKVQAVEVARYLIGALIVAPVVGGLVGVVVALAFALVATLHSGEPLEVQYLLLFAVSCGPIFGVPSGLLLGLVSSWPLRNLPPLRTIAILSGSTLAGALPFCFAGPLSVVPALMGYMAGMVVLMRTE